MNMASGENQLSVSAKQNNSSQLEFYRAVYKNELDTVNNLLKDASVDVNKLNLSHKSALYLAVENENVQMVKLLIDSNADINLISYCNLYCSYETPLVTSARLHNIKLVTLFLEKGCHLECYGNGYHREGKTALHWASDYGDISMAELLVKYGADINWKGPHMHSALHYAAISDQNDMVEWLLKNDAKITVNGDGRSILHIAAVRGNFETVKLMSEKLTFNEKDNFGFSPFSLACLRGHLKIVCHIFEKCYDKSELDMDDSLQRSAESGHIAVMDVLLQNGASVNSVNETGASSLLIACHGRHSQYEQLQAVKLLVENGAFINVVDSRGYTPLSMALVREQNDIAAFLIKHGASVDAVRPSCDSPLQIAFRTSNPLLVKYLIQAGCHFCREKWFNGKAADEKIAELDFHIPGPSRFRRDCQLQTETWEWIKRVTCQPRTLAQMTRRTIRQHLMKVGSGSSILPVIKYLPLPLSMVRYLSLDDVLLE